ncbi:MAG: hypothetical protein JWO95_2766, partial [Verrucomicrobiales bacterium]|nr:hypothetical protein [Verrucomicrobiales bacterium]
LLACCIGMTGCQPRFQRPSASVLPASELRAMQTRSYDALTPQSAIKTVVDVLQDDGYIVDYGNIDLGILHATKVISETVDEAFSGRGFFLEDQTYPSYGGTRYEATVNLSAFGQKTRIRISLQRHNDEITGSYLGPYGDVPTLRTHAGTVVDAKIYQEFFAKLDRGLFLQNQGL